MLVFLSLLFGSVRSQSGECDVGWTSHSNGYCYKFFDTPKDLADFTGIRLRCQTLGGDIATGAIRSERDLMYRLAQPFSQPDTVKNARVMAGIIWLKNGSWVSMDPTETVEIDRNFWCPGDPNYVGKETCTHFLPGRSCMWSYYCTFMRRNYICRKPQLTCKNENTIAKEGKCVCKEGYVDIRETDDLDKNKYKEGEKCVPKDPCNSLRQSFSLIFIVDASQSIQERNWPSLVDFVKSAANLLPNQVNVGFIKFSTKVSFAEWLPTKWSRREFEQMVPEDFDAGYTNTPAAIEKAIEMFDEDRRQTDKVAVLITDGLPVIDEQTDKDKGLTDTRAAISKLQRRGVDIVALGFGPELRQQRGDTYIKKWLSDPEEDYFSFDRMACDLRKVHMQMLLQKVCRRYV